MPNNAYFHSFLGKKEGEPGEEGDLMAELNANLANMIEKDKKKGKDSGGESSKNETSAEPTAEQKANPNLLKPTDIPAAVMEEKKNLINSRRNSKDAENKTEGSAESSATPTTESTGGEAPKTNNEANKTEAKQEVAPEAPKSPKKSALKNANNTPAATPEPPKSPKKGGPNSNTTPDITKEIQGTKNISPSILKSPVHSNKKVRNAIAKHPESKLFFSFGRVEKVEKINQAVDLP